VDLAEVESLRVGAAIAEAVGADAAALAAAVADPAVQDALVGRIVRAFGQATAAWSLRDDIFAYPGTASTAARIALDAVTAALEGDVPTAELTPTFPTAPAERLAAELAQVTYRDWRFHLDTDGEWVQVVVVADVEDCHRPGQTFTLSRSAPVRGGDVLDAARRAVLRVHEHEVLEHLELRGRAPLDPHRSPEGFVGPQQLPSD
jgi:hypothetical protein